MALSPRAALLHDWLKAQGASFFDELLAGTRLLRSLESVARAHTGLAPIKDAPAGTASIVNFSNAQTVPNLSIVRPGTDGKLTIKLFTGVATGTAQVVVDVFGYYTGASAAPATNGRFVPLPAGAQTVPGTGGLEGTVRLAAPKGQLTVYALHLEKKVGFMVYVVDGKYRATNLFPGRYEVSLRGTPGQMNWDLPQQTSKVRVAAGQVAKADFTLLGQPHLSFVLSVGVLPWPIVFIMTDVINDYYGVRGVRFLTLLTTGLITFAFAVMYFAIHMPAEQGWWITSSAQQGVPDMQAAFGAIFGQGMWSIAGSVTAFLVAQLIDVRIFHAIRRRTGDGKVYLRATGSTLVSQFFDSFIVLYIAFVLGPQQWSMELFLAIGTVNYCYKALMALALTPVIYAVRRGIHAYLGEDEAARLKQRAQLD